MNGVDTRIADTHPKRFLREYRGLICRAIIGRYAADVQSEWRVEDVYEMGQFSIADFLYFAREIEAESVSDYIGMIGEPLIPLT